MRDSISEEHLPSGGAVVLANSIYDPENFHPPSTELKSSIVEACFAVGRFIVASEKEINSGVLENYRSTERLHLVIGLSTSRSARTARTGRRSGNQLACGSQSNRSR